LVASDVLISTKRSGSRSIRDGLLRVMDPAGAGYSVVKIRVLPARISAGGRYCGHDCCLLSLSLNLRYSISVPGWSN
jgi:hypothetical protein